jgi:hypothetical protein
MDGHGLFDWRRSAFEVASCDRPTAWLNGPDRKVLSLPLKLRFVGLDWGASGNALEFGWLTLGAYISTQNA